MAIEHSGFRFDNTYTRLPVDFFKISQPRLFVEPKLVMLNHDLAKTLDLDFSQLNEEEQSKLFCGNLIPEGTQTFSQAYAGHQFGNFTLLGDGRAHLLGEHVTLKGKRFDIQFKGSGRTAYSRGGDGLAALGPMLREYIISEAMHALGIPTTRSLAVVNTGEYVRRDRFLPGAVLTRVASSHLRVGTFEFAARSEEPILSNSLLDYTLERHFPDLQHVESKALALINAVMERQIHLIVHWMRVGFIHGVMNTDNMALAGESIDFGPCAFMDTYNPDQVFSSIDHYGRYAFSNQARIAQWNLARLAESLLPLIDENQSRAVEKAKDLLYSFEGIYENAWLAMMRQKLGLLDEAPDDKVLISDLLYWMHRNGADFTNTFRDLSQINGPCGKIYANEEFKQWHERYATRRSTSNQLGDASIETMQRANPLVIPRNHLVEKALEQAENGDLSVVYKLLNALKEPYANKGLDDTFKTPSPTNKIYQTFCGT
jgi:serine/tyrosine/threonine adenylyltransferase